MPRSTSRTQFTSSFRRRLMLHQGAAAADGWQSEYSGSLIDMEFTQGTSSACVFRHDERQIVVSVHGDDFTCSGARPQLQWLEIEMRAKYELTVGARLGPGKDDDREGLVPNRVVRWTTTGIE